MVVHGVQSSLVTVCSRLSNFVGDILRGDSFIWQWLCWLNMCGLNFVVGGYTPCDIIGSCC